MAETGTAPAPATLSRQFATPDGTSDMMLQALGAPWTSAALPLSKPSCTSA